MDLLTVLLGFAVGVLVGFMGVGGGVVLVPAMVYLLHLSQHTAQGTSLFLQLPPLGLGALLMYWKRGQVDYKGRHDLRAWNFAGRIFREQDGDWSFLQEFARIVWPVPDRGGGNVVANARASEAPRGDRVMKSPTRLFLILLMATLVGVAGGLFGSWRRCAACAFAGALIWVRATSRPGNQSGCAGASDRAAGVPQLCSRRRGKLDGRTHDHAGSIFRRHGGNPAGPEALL